MPMPAVKLPLVSAAPEVSTRSLCLKAQRSFLSSRASAKASFRVLQVDTTGMALVESRAVSTASRQHLQGRHTMDPAIPSALMLLQA